jgi:aryl-alcohol dehydrogenase-like predicted oxidoreductase
VGAIGMKGFGGGNGIARQAGLTPRDAYRFALSQPIASQVVGMTTLEHLQENIALARGFKPFSAAEQAVLAEQVKPFATDGRFEQFKSTQNFDGPVHRRQHGFQA